MKTNIYLDCGGHYGEGLREFIQKYNINDDWVIEAFEPNPECNFSHKVSDIKLKNLIVHEKAVWIFNGEIMFSQENHRLSKSRSPSDGMSNIDGWGSVITELYSSHLKYTEDPIMVKCVDFHDILVKYPKNKFNVVVKLDIEGAEYRVLRHIISTGSVVNITDLFIEWHYIDLADEDMYTTSTLSGTLQLLGINVNNWK